VSLESIKPHEQLASELREARALCARLSSADLGVVSSYLMPAVRTDEPGAVIVLLMVRAELEWREVRVVG
jgi:hypothetical protein